MTKIMWSCVLLHVVCFGFITAESGLSNYYLEELYNEIAAKLTASESSPNWYTPPLPVDGALDYHYPASAQVGALKWVNPRKPEEEDKLVPTGYQFVSGGAGEGQQKLKPEGTVDSKQEVKTDADLPSYCSPPNPCPKGKTAADGCQENIPDTVSFNRNYIQGQMDAGYCACDYEHMNDNSCPSDGVDEREIDELFNNILENELADHKGQSNPYLTDGEKRKSLTAKKGGPHLLRKRNADDKLPALLNPYLQGDKLPVVAKKSPPMD